MRFAPFGQTRIVLGCEACQHRDLTAPEIRALRLASYGLDRGALREMSLDTFEPKTPNERIAREAALKTVERWRDGIARWLWFWSALREPPEMRVFDGRAGAVTGCGCGKTHLSAALMRAAVELGHDARMVVEGDLLNECRASYDDGAQRSEAAIVAEHGRPWLLVIDDVGTANVKSLDWYRSIYYPLINARYVAARPLVLTTNLPPPVLAERLGTRIMSRMEERGAGFCLDGPDRRAPR